MSGRSLKIKISLYLGVTLAAVVLLYSLLVIRHQREEMFQQAVTHANQLGEVVIKSTRFAMLQDQPSYIDQIIADVGGQVDIDRVRIISKDGTVIHSSMPDEVGSIIDQQAEACEKCHLAVRSGSLGAMQERARVFSSAAGERMLGNTRIISNEPSCSNADCHAHAAEQAVLGVLDIIYPLASIEQELRQSTLTMAGFSLSFVLVAATVVGGLVHRIVYQPLSDLEKGARALSNGRLTEHIPVRSDDEFGRVTRTFNEMTDALNASQSQLADWAQTLEEKVAEKTRELSIAQAEAIRGEKLASVGLLAAGIAHELNNPLTGVLTFASLVRQDMPDDAPEAEDLDLVIRETKRCATIIRRLLDFAREKAPEKNHCDINQLIIDTTRLIEQPAKLADIEIHLDLDPASPVIWIDEDLVKQVVMNLLVNAQHAIGEKGRITVRSRLCPEPMSMTAGAEPLEMVEVVVADTGCGIPDEHLPKIFDPFFTTKEVGKGTGLGLSVSHGAVLAHGGDIQVESELGEGTTFHVYLPVGG
jgi:two-component system NtrC family sensor kinase